MWIGCLWSMFGFKQISLEQPIHITWCALVVLYNYLCFPYISCSFVVSYNYSRIVYICHSWIKACSHHMMCPCRTMCFYVEQYNFWYLSGSFTRGWCLRGGTFRAITYEIKPPKRSWLCSTPLVCCLLNYKNSRRDIYHSSHRRQVRGMAACICMNKSKPLHIKLF